MTAEGWGGVTGLYQKARRLSGTERARFLDSACAADPALKAIVELLLAAGDEEKTPESTTTDPPAPGSPPPSTFVGQHFGPYLALQEIDGGGMGFVYLGVRDDGEFEKRVAIKVLRQGGADQDVVDRFVRERQILAGLDHECIAGLVDGGTTDEGIPYLVMEYVEGQPITEYCEARRLSVEERLELFYKVCDAVQYAHRNLVIHRDIKPGNILVTPRGTPKLLDFGIAKLLNPDLAQMPVHATRYDFRVMTPAYASPEQMRGEPLTTATDVYSLGVLLYQMVTGRRPYELAGCSTQEAARIVCEDEPERPSVAARREPETSRVQPKRVSRRLAGDVDNIVMMAMRKEPQRRYGSVAELAEDVNRHLERMPIRARRATLGYRLRVFVHRNRAAVLAGSIAAASLVAALVATMWQAQVAEEARLRAEQRFNEVRQLANSFLFEFHDAIQDLPGSTAARELVVSRALEYLDSLAAEAEQDRSLQLELATAYERVGFIQWNRYYSNVGDLSGSLKSQRRALAIRERVVEKGGDRVPLSAKGDLGRSHQYLGDLLFEMGEADQALEAYRKSKELREEVVAVEPDRNARLGLAVSLQRIGDTLGNPRFRGSFGDTRGALEAYRQMQDIFERLAAEDPSDPDQRQSLSIGHEKLGDMMRAEEQWDEALGYYRQALEIRNRLSAGNPNHAGFRRNLAIAHRKVGEMLEKKGELVAAVDHQRQSLELLEVLAAADPSDARARSDRSRARERLDALVARAHSGDR